MMNKAIRFGHTEDYSFDPSQTILRNFSYWLWAVNTERSYNGEEKLSKRNAWLCFKEQYSEKFKVDKYIPMPRFYSPFVQTLYNLGVGESIGDLSKKQAYKYRQHFYRSEFKPKNLE